MQAVVMTAPGGPGVLQTQAVADPVIQRDTEVLVRLKAAGVNPIDTKIRSKASAFPVRLPAAVLGCDGAGVVEAEGGGVRDFKVGDEVYFAAAASAPVRATMRSTRRSISGWSP